MKKQYQLTPEVIEHLNWLATVDNMHKAQLPACERMITWKASHGMRGRSRNFFRGLQKKLHSWLDDWKVKPAKYKEVYGTGSDRFNFVQIPNVVYTLRNCQCILGLDEFKQLTDETWQERADMHLKTWLTTNYNR